MKPQEKNALDLEHQQLLQEYQAFYYLATAGFIGFIGTTLALELDIRIVIFLIVSIIAFLYSHNKIKEKQKELKALRMKIKGFNES